MAVAPDLVIPRCLDMVTADDVIRAVEQYYLGGALAYSRASGWPALGPHATGNAA
jgi:hypothetical protein